MDEAEEEKEEEEEEEEVKADIKSNNPHLTGGEIEKNVSTFQSFYESWVVPAGVGSALADILGAEFSQIIDFVFRKGGVNVIKSILFWGGV